MKLVKFLQKNSEELKNYNHKGNINIFNLTTCEKYEISDVPSSWNKLNVESVMEHRSVYAAKPTYVIYVQ